MSIVSPIIKTIFTQRAADLEAALGEVVVTNTAVARVLQDQRSEAVLRGCTLVQDEPASVGGTAQGPTPTDYFVAAIAFCENVVFVRTAAMSDVDLEGLETMVTGDWDQRGLFEVAGASSGFRHVLVETRVRTSSPVEKVAEVARLTHRRCPVHQTLKGATELSFRLVVNDVETPL